MDPFCSRIRSCLGKIAKKKNLTSRGPEGCEGKKSLLSDYLEECWPRYTCA